MLYLCHIDTAMYIGISKYQINFQSLPILDVDEGLFGSEVALPFTKGLDLHSLLYTPQLLLGSLESANTYGKIMMPTFCEFPLSYPI